MKQKTLKMKGEKKMKDDNQKKIVFRLRTYQKHIDAIKGICDDISISIVALDESRKIVVDIYMQCYPRDIFDLGAMFEKYRRAMND